MNAASVLQRHRALRWLVPAGVAAVASLVATGVFQADASQSANLPRMTPAALLADVKAAPTTGFSGTILSRVSLGLPALPSLGQDANSSSMSALLSGSHTVQVWYGGPDQQRIALLGAMDETDFFRSGRQIWTWSSSDRVARHAVLPSRPTGAAGAPQPLGTAGPSVTPSALARQALAALSPTTQVQVRPGAQVADRDAYDLVLTPRTRATRVGSVHISVDASTKLPLAVRVYARGDRSPAVDVAYTSVRFTAPATTYFTFSPPAGATVRRLSVSGAMARLAGRTTHRVIGSGWTRVVEVDTGSAVRVTRGQLGQALTPVSGSWGSGGLLESSLVSVLVTSTGRILAGAVDPSALYAAAAAK